MNRERTNSKSRRRTATTLLRLILPASQLLLTSSSVIAETQAASHGTEAALILTGIITALFVLITFFVVVVLNGDVEPMIRLLRNAYNVISPKSAKENIPLDEKHDGISELDNRVPPWFNYLFGGTILFAVFYMLDYHVWQSSPLPLAEYSNEISAADISRRVRIAAEGAVDEETLQPLVDEASIKEGREKYLKNCVTCHGQGGEGIVGPNLTDRYWINGGSIRDVFATVKNGVPQKGMISWKLVFTPREIQQLASFVLTLEGTNPLNGKKPEGLLYTEPAPQQKDSVKAKR